jgi:3-hydroxybutyryl-CoA dehydrogenase
MGVVMTDPGSPEEIHQIGVIGAGQMGRGIAHVCALAGLDVSVVDIDAAALAKVHEAIGRDLSRQVTRGRITEEGRAEALARITTSARYDAFADCDLVIEAAVEREEIKRDIFQQLVPRLKPSAIIASNTSSLSITKLATATDRPQSFIGMHFMNPVPVMRLIEMVRSITTGDETLAEARTFGESLGKRVIVSKDRAGFIVNMLLIPYLLEAIRMFESGFAAREDIDLGMVLGTNHPMGPLTLLDYVGLDTTYYIANILYEELHEPKYAPPPLLKQMVTAGYLGRKSGRGFYDYAQGEQPPRA